MSFAAVPDHVLDARARKGDEVAMAELAKRGLEYTKAQKEEAREGSKKARQSECYDGR